LVRQIVEINKLFPFELLRKPCRTLRHSLHTQGQGYGGYWGLFRTPNLIITRAEFQVPADKRHSCRKQSGRQSDEERN
jgi:hypothetical protein